MKILYRSILLKVSVFLVFLFIPSFSFSDDIKIALRDDPGLNKPYVDLAFFGSSISKSVPFRNIHDSLFYILPDASIGMGVAEKVEATSDGLVWTIHLRKGVKFHNGKTVKANDVKFSLDRVFQPDNKYLRGRFSIIKKVKVLGEHTVEIHTKRPMVSIPSILAQYLPIVPSDYSFKEPVGCGPYKFKEYAPNDRLELVGFDKYYLFKPDFENVTIKFIPNDVARVAAFTQGEVQAASDIPYGSIEEVMKNEEAYLVPQKSRMYYLGINSKKPYLSEKSVRQGLNYAIDRKTINDEFFKGRALLSAGIISPGSFGANPKLTPYSYEPENAKKSIKSGFITSLAYSYEDKFVEKQAQAISAYLGKVGIKVQLKGYENFPQVYESYIAKESDFYLDWVWDRPDPYRNLNYFFRSSRQLLYDKTPKIVDKLNKAETISGWEGREKIYSEIDKSLYDDPPMIYLYSAPESFFVGSKKFGLLSWHMLGLPSDRQCPKKCKKNEDCDKDYKCVSGCCQKTKKN